MNELNKKLAALGFLLFLVLWVAGIVRTFTLDLPDLPNLSLPSSGLSSFSEYRGSLRTANNLAQIGITHTALPKVLGGLGVAIISTSAGLRTDRQCQKQQVGGEVLAYVW